MSKNKISIIFGIIFLLSANNSLAFQQDYTPNDPNIIYQSYFDLINIKPSWSNDLEINKEVIVAVLDSGIDLDHPDLKNNLWTNMGEIPNDGIDNDGNSYIDDVNGWDFIDSDNIPEPEIDGEYDYTAVNHGTVIAGIIAAEANNSGIVGIAPDSKIMPLRILNEKGAGNTLVLSQAIEYAAENGADIINLSLVGSAYNDDLKQAIIDANNKGIVIIAASGNEEELGLNLNKEPQYPVCDIGNINRVFGVAAVDRYKELTSFSNYGKNCIDISAPGTGFYSTVFHDSSDSRFSKYYDSGWSGTSAAAPIISATAALIKMNYPELRPDAIYRILSSSTSELKTNNPLNYKELGSGLIDIGNALNKAEEYINQEIGLVLAPEAGSEPKILILDNDGSIKSSFMAYADNFYGGVNIAVGDVNGDGIDEIVTAPLAGGGPHIRVFNKNGKVLYQFMAYADNFYGGVNIAIGDVNRDGIDEIVTAPLAGGGPHIRVFNKNGKVLYQFMAYADNFYGGVNIAIGDVKNSGIDNIITAPYSNHIPEIKVFKKSRMIHKFLAYDQSITGGIKLTVGDINDDNWKEIITVPDNNTPIIKLFNFKGRNKGEFLVYSKYLKTGIDIKAKDYSGDGIHELLTLPNKGSSALFKIYDDIGLEKNTFYLIDGDNKEGYNFDVLVN